MRKILVIVLVMVAHLTIGQTFPSDVWHEGKLVLLEGDTLVGKIKYDIDNDLVQLNIGNTLQTYSSRKILYFEIFDETVDNYRYFYALPYQIQPNYKVPIIFEVLYEGALTLLARETIVTENVPQYSYYHYRPQFYNTRARLDYNYYFLDKKGEIVKYTMKRRDLLDIMKNKSSQVKQYIKKNNLKYDKRSDLFRIVAYYNALIDS
ncbi:MAG: hypothetical protein ACNS62_20665 [Candidatus Cyclobacteriaceae bacterium M3_2C_046]